MVFIHILCNTHCYTHIMQHTMAHSSSISHFCSPLFTFLQQLHSFFQNPLSQWTLCMQCMQIFCSYIHTKTCSNNILRSHDIIIIIISCEHLNMTAQWIWLPHYIPTSSWEIHTESIVSSSSSSMPITILKIVSWLSHYILRSSRTHKFFQNNNILNIIIKFFQLDIISLSPSIWSVRGRVTWSLITDQKDKGGDDE